MQRDEKVDDVMQDAFSRVFISKLVIDLTSTILIEEVSCITVFIDEPK